MTNPQCSDELDENAVNAQAANPLQNSALGQQTQKQEKNEQSTKGKDPVVLKNGMRPFASVSFENKKDCLYYKR